MAHSYHDRNYQTTIHKKHNRHKPVYRFRFMAMSKLIGVVSFLFLFMITIYAMYEMHISQNYDALPQLIISAFSFTSIYAAFYLTMAKVEHIEEEKTTREKELALLKKKGASEEEVIEKKSEIDLLRSKMHDIISEEPRNLL